MEGADAETARAFYRFAADPARDAPFDDAPLWVGLEGGPTAVHLDTETRTDPAAWAIGELYAERSGPFSALDVLALSGGYYELRHGMPDTVCTPHDVPAELADFRPLTLSAPEDVTGACMEWWSITLFLDNEDLIRGVALRLGSP